MSASLFQDVISPTRAIRLRQAYLAGVLHGDGWCTKLSIGLRAKDRDFVEAFACAIKAVFGLERKPKQDERGYWLIRISNSTGRFNRLRPYRPVSNQERACWLRGFFDSEGTTNIHRRTYISPEAYSRTVRMYSSDPQILEKASRYLSSLKIANIIRPIKNGKGHKGTKPMYALSVLRRHGFEQFTNLVGSTIARKATALASIVSTYQASHYSYSARGGQRGAATRIARRDAGGIY